MIEDSDRLKRSTRVLALLLSIAALGGCGGGGGGGAAPSVSNAPPPTSPPAPPAPPPPPPPTGGAQFTKMLVLGGSIAAGFQSSGISATTQRQAYGALLATMAGAPFAIPELSGSGCPAPITTPLAASNNTVGCARAAALPGTTTGQLAAVPLTRVGDALVVASGNRAAFESLFIGSRSQVQVAQQVQPTFLIVHLGDDDVLPAAMSGVLGPPAPGSAPLLTEQATFSTQYNQLIGEVAATSIVGGVLIGVTNPILYTPLLQPGSFYFLARDAANRFEGKPVNNNCSPITPLGTPNPLSNNLVSLRILVDALAVEINCDPAALGAGSPFLVDAQEQAAMTARVDQFNSVISGIAAARNWIYLDMNALLAPLRAEVTAGRYDRLRKCQLLPAATNAAQFQNATLLSCPVPSGLTAAPNRFGSLSSFDALYPSAELHRLLAVKLATDINAKYATTVSTTPP